MGAAITTRLAKVGGRGVGDGYRVVVGEDAAVGLEEFGGFVVEICGC